MPISKTHEAWFADVCRAIELPEDLIPEALQCAGFSYGGATFGFMPALGPGDKCLAIHGIVGHVPASKRLDILSRVLEMQMLTAIPGGQLFGYDTLEDELILIQPITVEETSPELIVPLLRLMAASIDAWREILADPEPVAASTDAPQASTANNKE